MSHRHEPPPDDLEGARDGEQRRLVLRTAARRRFKRGEVVFHEGDPGDALHLIDKGRVLVRVSTALGDQATLAVRGPGDFFGELALVRQHALRTATVEALEPVETLVLRRPAFDDLATRHPDVRNVLVEVLAAQVERLSAQVLEALFVPADARVVRRLAHLAELFPGPDLPITQEALASMAGTTRPTANQALQRCAEAGLVELSRGRITVLDADGLARRAR